MYTIHSMAIIIIIIILIIHSSSSKLQMTIVRRHAQIQI